MDEIDSCAASSEDTRDALFQRPELGAFPTVEPVLSRQPSTLPRRGALLAAGVLGVAALVGCNSNGGPDCPTPTPRQTNQTCTSSNGTHYVYVPRRGWRRLGRSGVVTRTFGRGGRGVSG